MPLSQKGYSYAGYGHPGIRQSRLFEERDVEKPQLGPGEVLVRVFAAGTDPVDAKFRTNGGAMGLEAPIILGADISGVVEEVGTGVKDLAPGQEVYYTPEVSGPGSNGSYAEYHVARADIVAKKPSSLSHEEAAVPLAGARPTRPSSGGSPCELGRRSSSTAGLAAWAHSPYR